MLHIKTIIVFMVIIHVICAVVLMFLWMQNRSRYLGTGLWAINLALKAAGLLLIVMRGNNHVSAEKKRGLTCPLARLQLQ